MSDGMYRRPRRDEIEAKVRGTLPGAPASRPPMSAMPPAAAESRQAPQPAPEPLAAFSKHLRGRLRVLGWDAAALQGKAGISASSAVRAINGSSCDLKTAGQIAAALGLTVAAMTGPYACRTCQGEPHPGYRCLECGAERTAS